MASQSRRRERWKRLACGLVEVNVFARCDAARGGGNESLHLGLDGDGLQARGVQELFLSHHRHARVGLARRERRTTTLIRFDDADDLEVRRCTHGVHFSSRMRVRRADLPDADAGLRSLRTGDE